VVVFQAQAAKLLVSGAAHDAAFDGFVDRFEYLVAVLTWALHPLLL